MLSVSNSSKRLLFATESTMSEGIPSAPVSLLLRSMHSVIELADLGEKDDRQVLPGPLGKTTARTGWLVQAWVLMSNNYPCG